MSPSSEIVSASWCFRKSTHCAIRVGRMPRCTSDMNNVRTCRTSSAPCSSGIDSIPPRTGARTYPEPLAERIDATELGQHSCLLVRGLTDPPLHRDDPRVTAFDLGLERRIGPRFGDQDFPHLVLQLRII